MYTTREMKMAIEGKEEQLWEQKGWWVSNFLALKGLSQKSQTAYDIQTQIRNALSGFQFGPANGINPAFKLGETIDILENQIGKK